MNKVHTVILSIPHFLQEQPVSCVPASVRMVLAYLGIERTELELSVLLESDRRGTGVMHIELLQAAELGVTVFTGEMDFDAVKNFLNQSIPVIAAVWTASLPYWQENRPHAVVVVGYDEKAVYLNDPKFSDAPKSVSWTHFMTAWEAFGRFGAVIRKEQPEAVREKAAVL